MSVFSYLVAMVRDPNVASIAPTSRRGVRNVCGRIPLSACGTVVEYGPAAGVFTMHLLSEMRRPDARVVAIERNPGLYAKLKGAVSDPRATLVQGDVRDVRRILAEAGVSRADAVISGIPFSFLKRHERERLVEDSYEVLLPGGRFLAYQVFYQLDRFLYKHLKERFQAVKTSIEPVALPPLRIYEATKAH